MESRKVQLSGQSTYTISLPKEWARAQGIETGQRLTLRPIDSGRIVVSTGSEDPREPVVDLSGLDVDGALEALEALYTAGFDEFRLRADGGLEPAVRRAVTRRAGELVGVEVVAEDGSSMRFRDLIDGAGVSLPRVLSRVQSAALSAHREATNSLTEGTDDDARRAAEHRHDAATGYALLERWVNRTLTGTADPDGLGVSWEGLFEYARVGRALERVGVLGADLAEALTAADGRPPEPWCTAFSSAAQRGRLFIEHGVGATSAVSVEEATRLRAEHADCLEAVESLRTRSDAPESRLGYRAVDTLERTVDAGDAVRRVALRSTLRRTD